MTDNPPTIGEPSGNSRGYMLRPQIHRNDTYSWLAVGPLQIIWKVPNRRPIVHWTMPHKPFLFG